MLGSLQRQLIYFPTTATEQALLAEATWIGLEPWRDSVGSLIGWRSKNSDQARRRMLVFHGNAGYALHRQYYAAGLLALGDDWEVFLFEYPGYGARGGKPSADGIKAGARAALLELLESDSSPVYLTGESLGSGVATWLAQEFPEQVAGLLLVTPFTSLADVAAHHYPILPVRALLSERYDSLKALSHYQGPVAFLLAGSDEVVPTRLGQQLYDSYGGPRWLRIESGAGHNTLNLTPGAAWWREASDFLTKDSQD